MKKKKLLNMEKKFIEEEKFYVPETLCFKQSKQNSNGIVFIVLD